MHPQFVERALQFLGRQGLLFFRPLGRFLPG
jgi:hypothetical protein